MSPETQRLASLSLGPSPLRSSGKGGLGPPRRPSSMLRMGLLWVWASQSPWEPSKVRRPAHRQGWWKRASSSAQTCPPDPIPPPLPSADPYSQHTTVLLGGETGREDGP